MVRTRFIAEPVIGFPKALVESREYLLENGFKFDKMNALCYKDGNQPISEDLKKRLLEHNITEGYGLHFPFEWMVSDLSLKCATDCKVFLGIDQECGVKLWGNSIERDRLILFEENLIVNRFKKVYDSYKQNYGENLDSEQKSTLIEKAKNIILSEFFEMNEESWEQGISSIKSILEF